MENEVGKPTGWRENKRRQTLERIAETGLKLFIENGYEATTLDAIAVAAGISRRTFFYYFKSKEDVLLARHDGGFQGAMKATILQALPEQAPLDAVRECLLKLIPRYETKESVIVDGLMRSTEALRTRKEAVFVEMERTLVDAMCERWPSRTRQDEFRLVAMMAIGVLRLALDNWRRDNAKKPLAHYIRHSFALLKNQF